MAAPTVLLVDDNLADVELVRDAFAEVAPEVRVRVAHDAEGALALLADPAMPRPLGLIIDLNMPRVSGRELLAHVKRSPALASLPTVVLTSSASPIDRAACADLGCDAYVTKVHRLEHLNELVRGILAVFQGRAASPPPGPDAGGG